MISSFELEVFSLRNANVSLMVRWLHLVSAGVWTGGLITVAVAVGALRKAGAEREHMRAMALAFGKLSWGAMAVLVVTGVIQVIGLPDGSTNPRNEFGKLLFAKLMLVGLAAGLALYHQMTASTMSPKARGTIQGAILLISLGIFGVAVKL